MRIKTLFGLILVVCLPLFGQRRPGLNDGEMHGDAPYLLEDGWIPLLNGKDLSGWHGLNPGRSAWITTTGGLVGTPARADALERRPGLRSRRCDS